MLLPSSPITQDEMNSLIVRPSTTLLPPTMAGKGRSTILGTFPPGLNHRRSQTLLNSSSLIEIDVPSRSNIQQGITLAPPTMAVTGRGRFKEALVPIGWTRSSLTLPTTNVLTSATSFSLAGTRTTDKVSRGELVPVASMTYTSEKSEMTVIPLQGESTIPPPEKSETMARPALDVPTTPAFGQNEATVMPVQGGSTISPPEKSETMASPALDDPTTIKFGQNEVTVMPQVCSMKKKFGLNFLCLHIL